MKTATEIMLEELEGQLAIIRENNRNLRLEMAAMEGREDSIQALKTRIMNGMVKLEGKES